MPVSGISEERTVHENVAGLPAKVDRGLITASVESNEQSRKLRLLHQRLRGERRRKAIRRGLRTQADGALAETIDNKEGWGGDFDPMEDALKRAFNEFLPPRGKTAADGLIEARQSSESNALNQTRGGRNKRLLSDCARRAPHRASQPEGPCGRRALPLGGPARHKSQGLQNLPPREKTQGPCVLAAD